MRSNIAKIKPEILSACAETGYSKVLARFLEGNGATVETCHDASGVLRLIGRKSFDVLVLDMALALAKDNDVGLVSYVRQKSPHTRIVLLFDVEHIERAIEGIRQGAFFYLPKSSPPSDVVLVVEKALQSAAAETVSARFQEHLLDELMGQTPAMQRVLELVRKVSPTDSTVLLLGESGTGKEVLANTIHRLSRRHERPFVAINCAALPESLLESEMFGHVKGAFTGATGDKRGLFEEADGGTIFLDEIGDMALLTQAKLLRVLQSGDIRPVGASVTHRVDVRVIAATNRDLVEAVGRQAFREDLYFRLNVIQIRIPPLRERKDSLKTLIPHFIARHNAAYEKHIAGMDEHAASLLAGYEFPGNVRELESIIAHAVIMADDTILHVHDLPDEVRRGFHPRLAIPHLADEQLLTLQQMEEKQIRLAFERYAGNQKVMAHRLGISRSTLWRKLREYGLIEEK